MCVKAWGRKERGEIWNSLRPRGLEDKSRRPEWSHLLVKRVWKEGDGQATVRSLDVP